MASVTERSLAPDLNIVDIHDALVWSRTGHLTVVYRLEAFHEPGLDGAEFDAAALLAENCWSGLPEDTSYQFYVFVDQRRGVGKLVEALPAITGDGPKEQLLEEFRRARVQELTRTDADGTPTSLVQDRAHYVCATFRPLVPDAGPWALRVVKRTGPYVIALRRPAQRAPDLSAVVEKAFGARSTTRGWPTFERIAAAVRSLEAPATRARR